MKLKLGDTSWARMPWRTSTSAPSRPSSTPRPGCRSRGDDIGAGVLPGRSHQGGRGRGSSRRRSRRRVVTSCACGPGTARSTAAAAAAPAGRPCRSPSGSPSRSDRRHPPCCPGPAGSGLLRQGRPGRGRPDTERPGPTGAGQGDGSRTTTGQPSKSSAQPWTSGCAATFPLIHEKPGPICLKQARRNQPGWPERPTPIARAAP